MTKQEVTQWYFIIWILRRFQRILIRGYGGVIDIKGGKTDQLENTEEIVLISGLLISESA